MPLLHLPFQLSIPYPTSIHKSIYGPATSNVDFCETSHQFSPYIAELINTLSNSIYLIYAYIGIRALSHRNNLSFTTALPHLGLVAVGLGSGAYHATRLKGPQLADEIGMAVPTGAIVAQLLCFRVADPGKRKVVYWGSLAAVAAVYVVHCLTFSNWLHYPAFGGMVFFIGRRTLSLIRQIEDLSVRRKVKRAARTGEVLFIGAFALWLVDRLCCTLLSTLREEYLGLPWGWVLELHGWWHVGTGMGASVFIRVVEYLVEGGRADPGERLGLWVGGSWGKGRVEGEGNGHAKKDGRKKK